MKIFFLPTSYPNEQYPQKDIFIYEQAKLLASMGHEIIVLHVEKQPLKYVFKDISNEIKELNDGFAIRFSIMQKTFLEDRFPGLNRDLFVHNMERLYGEAVRKYGVPDVMYAHFSCWAGYAGAKLSIKYGVPLVTLEHFGGLLSKKVKRSLVFGVTFTLSHSKAFLSVSESLKNSIQRFAGDKYDISIIPNMVDSSFCYSPRIPKDKFVISSIGNLNKGKDFATLINAFCVAFSKEDQVILRIGGGGPEEEALKTLISSHDRMHQITLLGRLTREQTIREYQYCDCFALASRFETFGLVYREALVTGRPIVSTNHGGFSRSDWHDEYGFLVSIGDVSGIASALIKMRENIDLFDGKKISTYCLADCSPDIIGKRIETVLYDAIGDDKV